METLLKRDRLIISGGLAALGILAWAYMVREARGMELTGVCRCAGMKMSGPDQAPWSAASLLPLFLMWSEMMVAMMLPSAAPMLLTFAAVSRKRAERSEPFVPVTVFLLGYLLVWSVFSLAASLAQWALHGLTLLSPQMVSSSRYVSGALLLVAGIFQWTPLKNACLARCRSPLSLLLTDWREGPAGALWMGLKHGAWCTGCCWALMALLFVAGVMNIWWVAAVAALVLIEKLAGPWFARVGGAMLIGAGMFVLLCSRPPV